jgi:hypothetical protein
MPFSFHELGVPLYDFWHVCSFRDGCIGVILLHIHPWNGIGTAHPIPGASLVPAIYPPIIRQVHRSLLHQNEAPHIVVLRRRHVQRLALGARILGWG